MKYTVETSYGTTEYDTSVQPLCKGLAKRDDIIGITIGAECCESSPCCHTVLGYDINGNTLPLGLYDAVQITNMLKKYNQPVEIFRHRLEDYKELEFKDDYYP